MNDKPRARNWRDVRADAVESSHISEDGVAAARVAHADEEHAYALRRIRKGRDLSQVQLAAAMRVSQPRISAIERGELDHTELATLRAYVEALGGALHVSAQFGEEQVPLVGSSQPKRARRASATAPSAERARPPRSRAGRAS